MPKARRIAAGEPTRKSAEAAIDLAIFTPPSVELPRMKLPPLDETPTIEWGDTTPERVIASFRKEYDWVGEREVDEAYAEFRLKAASTTSSCAAIMAVASDALLGELLTPKGVMYVFWDEDDVDFFLARLGERAVTPLRAFHAARVVADVAMLRIRAPFVARIAAANLGAYVSERVAHHEWLLAHAELATKALLHAVLTDADDVVRQDACAGLRFLAARDDGELLRSIAREWKVTASLDGIALPRLWPPKPSKIPKAWGAIPLPNGDAKTTEKILAFLASEPDAAHPWTTKVLGALDIEAVRAFVSAMHHAWTSHGSAATHLWLVHADALVFGDAGLRRAGAWARTKSTSSNRNERNRAGRALEVLDRFPSPVATAQIADAATLAKAEWLRAKADRSLRVRMLTSKEDLDDILERAMPDLGFGAGVVIDYSARKFTAKARSDLSLVLVDDAGKTLDDLPKPRKSDDAKLAKAGIESWRALEAEVDGVAKVARDGWKPIYDEGSVMGVMRSLGGDRKASVRFSPGILLKEANASEKLKLGSLSLSDAFRAHERARIDLSEILRDLAGHRNPSMTSSASS